MRFVTTVGNYEEIFTNKNDTAKMLKQIDDGRKNPAWLSLAGKIWKIGNQDN